MVNVVLVGEVPRVLPHSKRATDRSISFFLRQLHLAHRQDTAYTLPSLPCPLDRHTSRAMAAPPQHLTAISARYK
jgi:hypothetical protein